MLCVFSNQVKWLVKRHEIIASHDRSPKIIGFLQKRGVVHRRRMCYTQSMEQLWTLLLLGRVWGRHAPTRSLRKCRRIVEVKSRMDRKFSRIENLWPRDGSCPLPLRSKPFLGNCFRIVKTQKISRGCAAHVMGIAVCSERSSCPCLCSGVVWLAHGKCEVMAQYHVQTAHEIFKVRLPRKEKYRPRSTGERFCRGKTAAKWIGCVAGRLIFQG